MKERALTFGTSGNLVGVLCEPEPDKRLPSAPAVLLWNVGIHHRVGPYRVFADLARRLAQEGFTSLRFDVAGQGDSAPRRGTVEGNPHVADIKEAMAFMEKKLGAKTFAPAAFCSGVDALHALAVEDARVVGLVYLEPYAWRTNGFWLRYPLRFANLERWRRRFQKTPAREAAVVDPAAQEEAQGASAKGNVFQRTYPTRERFRQDIEGLVARGVKLLCLYFGGDTDVNFAGQFWEMIGRGPMGDAVTVYFDRRADHILYRPSDRARALDATVAWVKQHLSGAASQAQAKAG